MCSQMKPNQIANQKISNRFSGSIQRNPAKHNGTSSWVRMNSECMVRLCEDKGKCRVRVHRLIKEKQGTGAHIQGKQSNHKKRGGKGKAEVLCLNQGEANHALLRVNWITSGSFCKPSEQTILPRRALHEVGRLLHWRWPKG